MSDFVVSAENVSHRVTWKRWRSSWNDTLYVFVPGVGISWHLAIRLDSDSEVSDSILKLLSMHLDAKNFLYNSNA